MRKKTISLDNFAKGAFRELVCGALQKVSANIYDPNTSEKAKREVHIKLIISPDEDRRMGDVEIAVDTKLCPVKSASTKLVLGYDEKEKSGEFSEFSTDMLGQNVADDFDDAEEEPVRISNVRDLRKKGGAM